MANIVELLVKSKIGDAVKGFGNLSAESKKTRSEIALLIGTFTKLGKKLVQATNYSDTYTASLRLLRTTLGETTGKATEFVNSLSKMTGLDETSIIKTVSKFSQLGESLNLSNESAEKFAEGLSTLSAKLAMLYNTDYSKMASNVQKAIQGTQTTLKAATGIYANEISEQALLMEKGINREVSSLNDAEKAIVRYATILRQVTNDNNVYQESVNSLAWQKQVLTAQVKRLATAIGSLLTPVLTRVYTVLNAVLIVIVDIIKLIGRLVGINVETSKSVGNVSAGYTGLGKSISGAANAAKKSLRGFDKLNNITTPSAGGYDAGGGAGIDPSVLGLLDDTGDQMLNIRNRADEIAESISSWLGFTRDENGELKFSKVTIGTVLTGLLAGLGIFKKLKGIFSFLSKIKLFGFLDKIPVFSTLITAVKSIGQGIALWIGGAGTFAEVFTQIILPAIGTIASTIGGIFGIIYGIFTTVTGIGELVNSEDYLGGAFTTLEGIGSLVAGIALLFGAWPVAAVAALVAIAAKIAKWIKENWEAVKNFFVNIWNKFVEIFGPLASWIYNNLIKPVIDFFKPIVQAVVDIFTLIIKRVAEIVTGIAKAVWSIITKIAEILTKIVEIFVAIGKAFYTYVVKPIWNDFLLPLFSWIYEKVIQPIFNIFKTVATWVYEHLIKPIWDKFVWLKDKVVEIFKNVATTVVNFASNVVKSVINGVLSLIESVINRFIRMLNGALDVINAIPGVNITKISLLSIPRLQEGGFPKGEDGLFYANHNELVGEFSNGKTAVANNDQIIQGIQQGVFNAMMSALKSSDIGGNTVIEAKGDTEGLLNFITFKQKQKDRQYN